MIAVVVLVVVLAVVAGLALVAGRRARQRVLEFETRAARAEREAVRELLDRLRTLRHSVGVLYMDGLPSTRSRRLFEAFGEGVKHASNSAWDRAAQTWHGALEHAQGSERVALHFLTGACRLVAGKRGEARANFATALAEAGKTKDRFGIAATTGALAMLARDEGRLPEALAGFTRAAALWGELDELREQSRALARAADVLEEQGDADQALARHREALRVCRQIGDAAGAVRAYGSLGRLLAGQGEFDTARAAYEDGLQLARDAGERTGEVDLLAAIGELLLRQRGYKRALDVLERALRHHQGVHSRVSEARILAWLAEASDGLGRAEVASEYYERALEKAREAKQPAVQADCLAGLAVTAQRHGVLEKAHSLLDEAVGLDRGAEEDRALGRHLVARAVLAVEMHDPVGAARDLDEALKLAGSVGDGALGLRAGMVQARMLAEDGRLADAQDKLRSLAEAGAATKDPELAADYRFEKGHVARAAGERDRALVEWRAAVEAYGKAGLGDAQARAQMFLAEALAESGRLEDGAAAATEALAQIHRSGTRRDEIRALRSAAFVDALRGRTRDAHHMLDKAVALARETGDRWSEAAVLLALGRLAREVEVMDAARDNLVAARRLFGELGAAARVIEIDREVERLPSPGTGVQFLDGGH